VSQPITELKTAIHKGAPGTIVYHHYLNERGVQCRKREAIQLRIRVFYPHFYHGWDCSECLPLEALEAAVRELPDYIETEDARHAPAGSPVVVALFEWPLQGAVTKAASRNDEGPV
jgi:hypothetical protein